MVEKKVDREWMFWEALQWKRFFARLGWGRNRKRWSVWRKRNIWKQQGHPRGARKTGTYRECTGRCVAGEANVLLVALSCILQGFPWSFGGDAGFSTSLQVTHLRPPPQAGLQQPGLTGILLSPLPREQLQDHFQAEVPRHRLCRAAM